MAVTLVQSAKFQDTGAAGTSASFTLGTTPTVGNKLLFVVCWWTGDGPLVTPSGWTRESDYEPANQGGIAVFSRTVQSGDGTSWTLTYDSVADQNSAFLLEISGYGSINQNGDSTNASAATSLATASVTPSVLNCLGLAFWVSVTSGGTDGTSVSTGWTKQQVAESSFQPAWFASKNALTSDTVTAISATLSGMPSAVPSAVILLIAPPSGTPTNQFFAVL